MNKWNVLFILLLFSPGGSMELFSQCCKPVVLRKNNCSGNRFNRKGTVLKPRRRIKTDQTPVSNSEIGLTAGILPDKKRYTRQEKESLEALRKIHEVQRKILRAGNGISFTGKRDLFLHIHSLRKKLEIPLRQIRNFPHKQTLDSLEDHLEKLYQKDRGLVSKEKHLLHIQKLQIKSLQNHINRNVLSRQSTRSR